MVFSIQIAKNCILVMHVLIVAYLLKISTSTLYTFKIKLEKYFTSSFKVSIALDSSNTLPASIPSDLTC